MAKRKRKLDPNRFQKGDGRSLFSFDPARRNVLMWGVITGALGGSFMLINNLFAQIAGILIVVFLSNYRISRASRRIPRWHATVVSFIGIMAAMFGVIIVGSIILTVYRAGGG